MADTAAAEPLAQNNDVAITNNNNSSNKAVTAKGRGRPKKANKVISGDGDTPDAKTTDNSTNNVARVSQRKASLAASTAMREQAQGSSKKESEVDEDGEPKAKKARGRPKAANATRKSEKEPKKKGSRGRPAKGAANKKKAENNGTGSDEADGNTDADESGDHAE